MNKIVDSTNTCESQLTEIGSIADAAKIIPAAEVPAGTPSWNIDCESMAEPEEPDTRDPNFFLRSSSLLPQEAMEDDQVRIIGVGGIGRQVALQGTSVGIGSIVLYDSDRITIHNVGSQGYPYTDIDGYKVQSLLNTMQEIVPTLDEFIGYESDFPLLNDKDIADNDTQEGPVFCCVDKISTRATLFDLIERCPIWIDGRMTAETGRIITVLMDEPKDVDYYRSTLFPQEEQEPENCTSKATIYCGNFIAAIMVKQYTRWMQKEIKAEDRYRDLMFNLKTFDLFPYEGQPKDNPIGKKKAHKKSTKGGGKNKKGAKRKSK